MFYVLGSDRNFGSVRGSAFLALGKFGSVRFGNNVAKLLCFAEFLALLEILPKFLFH